MGKRKQKIKNFEYIKTREWEIESVQNERQSKWQMRAPWGVCCAVISHFKNFSIFVNEIHLLNFFRYSERINIKAHLFVLRLHFRVYEHMVHITAMFELMFLTLSVLGMGFSEKYFFFFNAKGNSHVGMCTGENRHYSFRCRNKFPTSTD